MEILTICIVVGFLSYSNFLYTLVLFSTGNLGARSYPLSYVYSGNYYWDTGRLYLQTVNGLYWSSSIVSSTNSYYQYMYNTRLFKAPSYNKRIGLALRCQIDMLSLIDAAHGTTKTFIIRSLWIVMVRYI